MSKKVVGLILGALIVLAMPFFISDFSGNTAEAQQSVTSIFKANVSSVLSQSVQSCGTTDPNKAVLTNNGSVSGNHFSSCFIRVLSTTNAPGYNLMIQSIDGVQRAVVDGSNNWLYDMSGSDTYAIPYGDGAADGNTRLMVVRAENTPPTLPTLGSFNINSTSSTISSPAEMNASAGSESIWGFAVPSTQTGTVATGFDASYSTFTSSAGNNHGKYAKVPTTATPIRQTSTTATNEATDVYFGASIYPNQPAGVYQGVVVFTTTINPVVSPAPSVIAVYPESGELAGNTTIDIYGSDFTGVTSVTVGGTACSNVSLVSDSHLTCTLPAKTAGAYSVVVTTTYGASGSSVKYTYTATPVEPGPNPYEPSNDGDNEETEPFFAPFMYGGTGGSGVSETSVDDGNITEPQGRTIFENLATSVGDEDYNGLWLAIGGGTLLACLLVFLSFLLGRRWDIYITEELKGSRPEVMMILVEKVGLDTKKIVASLQTIPAMVVEGVSRSDSNKIATLLEDAGAQVEVVRHGRLPELDDTEK